MAYLASAALLISVSGCKANPPGKVETRVVTSAKHHLLVGNKDGKNPLSATPQSIADGKEAFSHYCVAWSWK